MLLDTSKLLEHFEFEATQSTIDYFEPHVIWVRFGQATDNPVQNTAESHWVLDSYNAIKAKYNNTPVHILVDISPVGNGEFNTDESNDIYKQILRDPYVYKVGVYGVSAGWKLFLDMFNFISKNKLSSFTTQTEAVAWLEEELAKKAA